MIKRQLPETPGLTPTTAPRRYTPPPGEHMPHRKMPEIYDRHRIFAYWYIPVAILLAVVVALGVIWTASQLFGGNDTPAAPTTPVATQAPGGNTTPPPQTQAPGSPTAGPTPSPSASTGPGTFSAGQTLVVTGTGDCLNVRTDPGRENDAIVCLNDGAEVTVTGGPTEAGDLIWWKVRTELGEGWAAEDYLIRKP